jgi:hypothetical protein
MKVSRFLTVVGLITFTSLVYVWQQIRLVEFNYQLLQKERIFSKLIDQNRILQYNVFKLKSPGTLENRLYAKHINLKYTRPAVIAQNSQNSFANNRVAQNAKRSSFFVRAKKVLTGIFALRSQVEALP